MSPTIQRTPPLTNSKTAAAVKLGISVDAVSDLIASGELKTIKLPRNSRPRVLQSSIDDMFTKIYGDQRTAG